MNKSIKDLDNETNYSENTNPLPILDNYNESNEIIIKDLNNLLEGNDKKISCLPCKALQEYKILHDHYNKVRKDVIKSIKDCGLENSKDILEKIENNDIKCNDFDNSNSKLSDIEIIPIKKTSLLNIAIKVLIIILFGLFVYFFERKRCICPVPNN